VGDIAWRLPSGLQFMIPALVLATLYFIPESPRCLVSKGKSEKAKEILTRFHGEGDEESPLVQWELNIITQAITLEQESDRVSWRDLLSTPGNRHRTYIAVSLGITAQITPQGIIAYYFPLCLELAGITDSYVQAMINAFINVGAFGFSILSSCFVDYFGRRTIFMTSSVCMLVFWVIITALSAVVVETNNVNAGIGAIVLIFCFRYSFDIAYNPLLYSYPAEVFQYSHRAKGLALTLMCSFMSLFVETFVNPIGLANLGWRYYLVFIAILVLIVLNNYFFYPETKGNSLEEIARIFDGSLGMDTDAFHKQDFTIVEQEEDKRVVAD